LVARGVKNYKKLAIVFKGKDVTVKESESSWGLRLAAIKMEAGKLDSEITKLAS
jgi:hypothetical protein